MRKFSLEGLGKYSIVSQVIREIFINVGFTGVQYKIHNLQVQHESEIG